MGHRVSSRPRFLPLRATSVLAILNFIPALLRAACPHPTPPPNSEFFKASSVIVARVLSEKSDINPHDTALVEGWLYRLRIEKTFRGSPQQIMTVYTENTNGRFPLKVGERYLLFVYRDESRLTINGCGNSAPLSDATSAIAAIEAIKRAGPYGEIDGRVQLAIDGDGVPGVRVVARMGKRSFSTVSGEDGRFRMKVLPGKYQLSANSSKFSIVFSDTMLGYDDPDRFVVHRGGTTYFEYIASPN